MCHAAQGSQGKCCPLPLLAIFTLNSTKVRYMMGENQEVVWPKCSTLDWLFYFTVERGTHLITTRVENQDQVPSSELKFAHDFRFALTKSNTGKLCRRLWR
jgi:hypothetical protein